MYAPQPITGWKTVNAAGTTAPQSAPFDCHLSANLNSPSQNIYEIPWWYSEYYTQEDYDRMQQDCVNAGWQSYFISSYQNWSPGATMVACLGKTVVIQASKNYRSTQDHINRTNIVECYGGYP
jgi:hypothetical protein